MYSLSKDVLSIGQFVFFLLVLVISVAAFFNLIFKLYNFDWHYDSSVILLDDSEKADAIRRHLGDYGTNNSRLSSSAGETRTSRSYSDANGRDVPRRIAAADIGSTSALSRYSEFCADQPAT